MKLRFKIDGRPHVLEWPRKRRKVEGGTEVQEMSQEEAIKALKAANPESARLIDRAMRAGWIPYTGGPVPEECMLRTLYGREFRSMTREERARYANQEGA